MSNSIATSMGDVKMLLAEVADLKAALQNAKNQAEEWHQHAEEARGWTRKAEAERDELLARNAGHPSMCCGQCAAENRALREALIEIGRLAQTYREAGYQGHILVGRTVDAALRESNPAQEVK